MENIHCLYIITNKATNKKYLGITKDFKKRKLAHLGLLRRNQHHSMHLQNSFNKHGEDKFEFSILVDDLSREKAGWLEEFYLQEYYDNIYNVSKKSSGGDLTSYHPNLEEIREKHRTNRINWWNSLTEEEKAFYVLKTAGELNGMFGKTHSREAREKISRAHSGRKHTELAKKNMSLAQKERYKDPKEREKCSEANRKRYEDPEERRKTGEASRKAFAEKRARGDWDNPSPERLAKIIGRRFVIVYEGVEYRGWKEVLDATGLSMPTIRKRLLDDNFPDSYYITEPRFTPEETKRKMSNSRKGKTHSDETKRKMAETGLKRYEGEYLALMPDGETYSFTNLVYLHDFLIEEHDMRKTTINNLLRTGETWKPKKHIHKKLHGLKLLKIK